MGMETSAASDTLASTAASLPQVGDADARVAEIYASHYQRTLGLASLLAGGRALGEELAQECFVIALRNERRTPGYLADPVWPWLQITTVHLAGRLRERLRRELVPNLLRTTRSDVSPAWAAETIDVVRALRRLPYKMRLCVVLAHLEDQSTASIASTLGCSVKTVENELRTGRQRLRTILGEGYNNT
jgi:DNA-directed RNA polymerase specialized sigma24 family protein